VVGSGKSNAADEIVRVVEADGLRPRVLRFQWLPCFTWFRWPGQRPTGAAPVPQEKTVRTGYRRKRLSAGATLGYIARTVAFRLFRLVSGGSRIDVCDRYFYDNLAHYELRSRRERMYERALRLVMPTPDLAILLVASADTLARRRPEFAGEYLVTVSAAFAELRQRWPELVEINTDPDAHFAEALETRVRRCLATAQDRRSEGTGRDRHGSPAAL
jgi:thymidylate kinase